jgi:hypothetical protein
VAQDVSGSNETEVVVMTELEQAMLRYYEGIAYANRRIRKPRLGPRPEPKPPRELPEEVVTALQAILADVGLTRRMSEQAIRGRHRIARIINARQEFYYRAAKETALSYDTIGAFFGRDSSTIRDGISVHCERYGLDHPRRAGA